MSCNCGCHDDKQPAAGWKRCVPLVIAVLVVAALVVGAVMKPNKRSDATDTTSKQAAARP